MKIKERGEICLVYRCLYFGLRLLLVVVWSYYETILCRCLSFIFDFYFPSRRNEPIWQSRLHKWVADGWGRTRAMPHIKTFLRYKMSPVGKYMSM